MVLAASAYHSPLASIKTDILKIRSKFHLAILTILLISCRSTNIYYGQTDISFKGRVKEISTEYYWYLQRTEHTEIDRTPSAFATTYLNKKGNIDSIHHYGSKGEILYRHIFEIENKSISKEIKLRESDGKIKNTITHSHRQGNIYDYIIYDGGNRISSKGYKIVENELVLRTRFDFYGKDNYITDYVYDNHNRLVRTIRTMNKKLKFDSSIRYLEFDKKGNWIKRIDIRQFAKGSEMISMHKNKYKYY